MDCGSDVAGLEAGIVHTGLLGLVSGGLDEGARAPHRRRSRRPSLRHHSAASARVTVAHTNRSAIRSSEATLAPGRAAAYHSQTLSVAVYAPTPASRWLKCTKLLDAETVPSFDASSFAWCRTCSNTPQC